MLHRADHIISFEFPRDHGRHHQFGTEWWYVSGRLSSDASTDWAYHFTIFRRAFEKWSHLALVGLAISAKSIRNVGFFKRAFAKMLENQELHRIGVDGYVGHLSITNISEKNFTFFERGGTSIFNVAGASDNQLNVWVKGWKLCEENGLIHLTAKREKYAIDLVLTPEKKPILNGEQGLSVKGPEPGAASYHYSLASLRTTGTLEWQGNKHQVAGSSFMDREFGTSILPRSLKGWDWFGLLLDNNHEMMISLIRNLDGTMAETSSGTLVLPDGSWKRFNAGDLQVQVLEKWPSSVTGAHYPVHWMIEIEPLDLWLEIRALVKEHELVSATSTTINYWEGPVDLAGEMSGKALSGHGHVELVGYAESAGGKF